MAVGEWPSSSAGPGGSKIRDGRGTPRKEEATKSSPNKQITELAVAGVLWVVLGNLKENGH